MKIKLLLLILLVLSFGIANADDSKNDLEIIKTRVLQNIVNLNPDLKNKHVQSQINGLSKNADNFVKLLENGSWKDVQYKDNNRADWKTIYHLSRLKTMAMAYRTPGHELFKNEKLKQNIIAALEYWYTNDFKCPNWWFNEISVPQHMGTILLLMEDDLTPAQIARGVEIMKRSNWTRWTGQNLVWGVGIQITRGCLENSQEVVSKAFQRMLDEIIITRGEGVQEDYSFHQHGHVLYSSGYGLGFSIDCSHYAHLARGTQFEFPKDKIDILSGFILDGQRWMIRNGTFDYGAVGRSITRRGGGNAQGLISACRNMAALKTKRQAEFQAFEKSLRSSEKNSEDIEGNRHFWKSDIMTHKRKAFYVSARMFSNRLANTDAPCNNEGKKSHHVADGSTFIFQTGKEYWDIFPVWEWKLVPGTTVEQTPKALTMNMVRRNGTTSFVGGVSDDQYGMAAMDLHSDSLIAKKSWFFFDDEFVCLGTDIKCPTENNVFTSINQCLLNGDVIVSENDKETAIEKGKKVFANAKWIYHDSIAYIFPQNQNVNIKCLEIKGKWDVINSGMFNNEPASANVFNLWIDHGKKINNATYSYIVAPGIKREAINDYAKADNIKIHMNTAKMQAVSHKKLGITQIVFWQPGNFEHENGLTIQSTKRCLLQIRKIEDGYKLAVSNPENRHLSLNIVINKKLTGENCTWNKTTQTTTIQINLPGGEEAGQSVVEILKIDSKK